MRLAAGLFAVALAAGAAPTSSAVAPLSVRRDHTEGLATSAASKAPAVARGRAIALQAPAASSPAVTPPAPSAQAGPDPALLPLPIPDTVPEMLAQLRTRVDETQALIDRGSFPSIYVPAFQAKDLVLALDAHVMELPSGEQARASGQIADLVRNAYLLDAFGDIGNRARIAEAFTRFSTAASGIASSFSTKP
jgi:hypothetical protein